MTLTYNANLARVKVDTYAKYQGRRSNASAVRAHTDGRTLPSMPFQVVTKGRIKPHEIYTQILSLCPIL